MPTRVFYFDRNTPLLWIINDLNACSKLIELTMVSAVMQKLLLYLIFTALFQLPCAVATSSLPEGVRSEIDAHLAEYTLLPTHTLLFTHRASAHRLR